MNLRFFLTLLFVKKNQKTTTTEAKMKRKNNGKLNWPNFLDYEIEKNESDKTIELKKKKKCAVLNLT